MRKRKNCIYLITSNQDKVREYNRISDGRFEAKKGIDLPEPLADPLTIILHKSKSIGSSCAVEDTILLIDGKEAVDIKFRLNELKKLGPDAKLDATWQVMIGYKNGPYIEVYVGTIHGALKACEELPKDAFGFDPYFYPNNTESSLYELDKAGKKDFYSARVGAVNDLLSGHYSYRVEHELIDDWKGEYQK